MSEDDVRHVSVTIEWLPGGLADQAVVDIVSSALDHLMETLVIAGAVDADMSAGLQAPGCRWPGAIESGESAVRDAIIRDLAAADPVSGTMCELCQATTRSGSSVIEPEDHAEGCPWLRARAAVAEMDG